MSEFLLAFLTLSGLLPIAKVLTVGADPGKETTSLSPLSLLLRGFPAGDACRQVMGNFSPRGPAASPGPPGRGGAGLPEAEGGGGGSLHPVPESWARPRLAPLLLGPGIGPDLHPPPPRHPPGVFGPDRARLPAHPERALRMLEEESAFPRLPSARTQGSELLRAPGSLR